jgi:hypothetical protein
MGPAVGSEWLIQKRLAQRTERLGTKRRAREEDKLSLQQNKVMRQLAIAKPKQ